MVGFEELEELLEQAVRLPLVLPRLGRSKNVQNAGNEFARAAADMWARSDEWDSSSPAFCDVWEWVDTYWDPGRPLGEPRGVMLMNALPSGFGEIQLDSATATCKLLLAAKEYGAGTIAKVASDFALHGMAETYSVFLFKGQPISSVKALDDHCALVPYHDALQMLLEYSSRMQRGDREREWLPTENVYDVCALVARGFRWVGGPNEENRRYESVLLRYGPETLVLSQSRN